MNNKRKDETTSGIVSLSSMLGMIVGLLLAGLGLNLFLSSAVCLSVTLVLVVLGVWYFVVD